MYETEIYINTIKESLPEKIVKAFLNTQDLIVEKSTLHWSEHCTECAMPQCFKTCGLYAPRIDGKCKRFVRGIERIDIKNEKLNYILKIQFKKWGVLSTQANNELYDLKDVQNKINKDFKIAKVIDSIKIKALKKRLIQKRYSLKKQDIVNQQNKNNSLPDVFLFEVYNPSDEVVPLIITLRNDNEKYRKFPFQYRIELSPGYNKEMIPFDEIAKRIKTNLPYRIDMIPENIPDHTPLYFGVNEFVKLKSLGKNELKASKIKCVVWDLDNTLWDGVLIEDGIENIKLKEGIESVLKQIEEKGIINSIASKNNFDPAMAALKHFNIEQYFLFPKISWNPKSKSLKDIALGMNVNVNSLLFIDDSIFERNEVEAVLPQVKVLDALHYKVILEMDEFQIPITKESKARKQFYVNEINRKLDSEEYEGEYFDFLKSCNIELEIMNMQEAHFERVYELTQRTNQMNFSGNRYKQDDIRNIYNDEGLDAYVLRCRDRFGEYGIIGFSIIKKSENKLIDLMFSCRIQSKRVEHAFITFCLKKYLPKGDFYVTYKHTEKNKFSAQVFYDFNFTVIKKDSSNRCLKFTADRPVVDDKIISVKS